MKNVKTQCGFSNKKELEFAKFLSKNNKPIWIRQVLIPSITDDEKDLIKLKEFISSLKTVEKIEILPYHSLGKYKWENLGLAYQLENIPDATAEDVNHVKEILEI